MAEPLRVRDAQLRSVDGEQEVSVMVGDFRLWYRFPGDWPAAIRPEAFLHAAIVPAMALGRDLEMADDLPIPEGLAQPLDDIQGVHAAWGRRRKKVPWQRIGVRLNTIREAPPPVPIHASYFSGGVDGTFTFLDRLPDISHVIFLRGIDMQVDNHELYSPVLEANRAFVEAHGKQILSGSTNVRMMGHHFGLGWNSWNGAGLCSVAAAFGVETIYIAAGYTWAELGERGLHPVTIQMRNGGATRMVSHGDEFERTDKLRRIALEPGALDILRVCWQDDGYNCGRCEKCLRTMLALHLLQLEAPKFPPLPPVKHLSRERIDDHAGLIYADELRRIAVATGRTDIANALAKPIRRYRLRQLMKQVDADLLGGRLRRLVAKR
jgi:hypothetical protein